MKVKEEFVFREIAGDYIIVPTGNATLGLNGMLVVNEVGASIWKMLEDEMTFEELVAGIREEYEVEEDVARRDVEEFLEKLKGMGII